MSGSITKVPGALCPAHLYDCCSSRKKQGCPHTSGCWMDAEGCGFNSEHTNLQLAPRSSSRQCPCSPSRARSSRSYPAASKARMRTFEVSGTAGIPSACWPASMLFFALCSPQPVGRATAPKRKKERAFFRRSNGRGATALERVEWSIFPTTLTAEGKARVEREIEAEGAP